HSHELAAAFSPGPFFTWKTQVACGFWDFPFLHLRERSVLNQFCRLGADYIQFFELIVQSTGLCTAAGGRLLSRSIFYRARVLPGSH
uniref:Uncharacterized protein n=1 Tax=Mus spicilegus TaxID=10103 RepID=A0A8C6GB46_MUSSI